jgi:transcriptional repressor NrdR
MVRKRDGRVEPFDLAKVRVGMVRAVAEPASHAAALDAALARIEAFVEEHSPEVTTEEIGRQVLAELRHLDEAAYVRFASVYKDFSEASDFSREVESLEKRR